MLTSGFTNAPVTRFLVLWTVVSALATSLTDTRYYFHIQVSPHFWTYAQFWRGLVWQLSFTNSTEVLFASMAFYQLRVVERAWGARKFASFILSTLPYTTILPPLILTLVLRPLTFGRLNHLPAGPTPLLFALLAQYYATIPSIYKYRLTTYAGSSASPPSTSPSSDQSTATITSLLTTSITLTSKTLSYILPLQLSLSQFPGSFLAAAVGWAVGMSYRRDMLPYAQTWRVPAWVVGETVKERGFEGLRRRLEGEREREGGLASGILAGEGVAGGEGEGEVRRRGQRRTLGQMVVGQFTGR